MKSIEIDGASQQDTQGLEVFAGKKACGRDVRDHTFRATDPMATIWWPFFGGCGLCKFSSLKKSGVQRQEHIAELPGLPGKTSRGVSHAIRGFIGFCVLLIAGAASGMLTLRQGCRAVRLCSQGSRIP